MRIPDFCYRCKSHDVGVSIQITLVPDSFLIVPYCRNCGLLFDEFQVAADRVMLGENIINSVELVKHLLKLKNFLRM